jgi:Uma2 family endonuclease
MQQYPLPVSAKFLAQDDGVNAPLHHQQIISRLHVELGILYYKQQAIPYEPLPETMLTEGYGNPVPDILLYDHEAEKTRIIIEICQTSGEKSDLRKVIRLIEDEDYGILEGFIFNYKTHVWVRYRKGDGGQATETAYSDILSLNLNDFL